MALTSNLPAREINPTQTRRTTPKKARYAEFASKLAAFIPALALFDPVLLWQLLYAEQLATISTFASPPPGSYSTYLLHKVWFPPLFLLAAALFLLSGKRIGDFRMNRLFWWFAYFAWGALTVSWAIAPGISFQRYVFQIIIFATLVLSFVTCRKPDDILKGVFWLVALTAAINLARVLIQTPGPLGYEGIYEHKNGLGAFASCAILVSVVMLSKNGWFTRATAMIVIAVGVLLLVLSTAKTPAGVVPLALVLGFVSAILSRYLRMSPALTFGLFLAFVFFVIAMSDGVLGISPEELAELVTGDATFTGRTDLWSFAWEYYVQRPLTGFGFKSFWNVGVDSPSLSLGMGFIATVKHGHNGYFDVLLGGGLVALLLFLPALVIALHLCGRLVRRHFTEGAALICLMIFFIFHNLLESSFFDGANFVFMHFQILWLYIAFSIPNTKTEEMFARNPQVRHRRREMHMRPL